MLILVVRGRIRCLAFTIALGSWFDRLAARWQTAIDVMFAGGERIRAASVMSGKLTTSHQTSAYPEVPRSTRIAAFATETAHGAATEQVVG